MSNTSERSPELESGPNKDEFVEPEKAHNLGRAEISFPKYTNRVLKVATQYGHGEELARPPKRNRHDATSISGLWKQEGGGHDERHVELKGMDAEKPFQEILRLPGEIPSLVTEHVKSFGSSVDEKVAEAVRLLQVCKQTLNGSKMPPDNLPPDLKGALMQYYTSRKH